MDIIAEYINQENLILIPVIYIIGVFLKKIPKFNDKYIPLVLLLLASILSFVLSNMFNLVSLAGSIIQGILITGVAVLGNQIYKQLQNNKALISFAENSNDDQKGEIELDINKTEVELLNIDTEKGGENMPVKIYLDAGHGGNDPGAIYHGYKEKDLNLEAVLYIGKRLEELGAEVGYSRTTDINPGEVYSRGTKAKGYNYFLSIHCNAGGGSGAEIIVNCKEKGAEVQSNYKEELSKLGNFRKIYSRRYSNGKIVERTIENGRFTNQVNDLDWYGVLRGSYSVGVIGDLLELFFMDNIDDLNNYLSKKEKYWEVIIKSIAQTFGLEYIESNGNNIDNEELNKEIEKLKSLIEEKDIEINALNEELNSYRPITLYQKEE